MQTNIRGLLARKPADVSSGARAVALDYTVLIERRARQWLGTATALALIALLAAGSPLAQAAPHHKVARDLQEAVESMAPLRHAFARDLGGVRHMQVIVAGTPSDPEMNGVRAFVLRTGGSVQARHPGINALTVVVRADQVRALADRDDVQSVTPNRPTRRTASVLETITGSLTANVRPTSSKTNYSGLDGSGVGIAVLDSGVMKSHSAFVDALGLPRVKRNVDMLNGALANWGTGADATTSLKPGSLALQSYENGIATDNSATQDPFGHGTHVASVAAGRARLYKTGTPDTTGLAPNANLYDVKVLDANGNGTISDAIEGIQWVIYHAREYKIRVLNISLAAESTQSWQTDPLCAAVRSAVAAGITVVVAGGNYGLSTKGAEVYGAISAPGNDPSVITVGAVNFHDTAARSDDSVNFFSSRGPTRGALIDAQGRSRPDNLLKPDLVAPGNRIVGAGSTQGLSSAWAWGNLAKKNMAEVVTPVGITQVYGETQMMLSGTSIAAPAVSGTVALMLQANPGLTPPLVKAILQYTAQPLAGHSLLQQGAGYLNVDGAVVLARVLRTDLASAIEAGTIAPGTSMLAAGASLAASFSKVNGLGFEWSRIVFVGGNQIVTGGALLNYQPIYDPRLTWANGVVRKRQPIYWSGVGITPNTFVHHFTDVALRNQPLLGTGVVIGTALAGTSSLVGRTGVFLPTATLSAWLLSGSGTVLWNSGLVLSEGLLLSEGLILSEGLVLSEGLLLSEGLVLSESKMEGESGSNGQGNGNSQGNNGQGSGTPIKFNTTGALAGER